MTAGEVLTVACAGAFWLLASCFFDASDFSAEVVVVFGLGAGQRRDGEGHDGEGSGDAECGLHRNLLVRGVEGAM